MKRVYGIDCKLFQCSVGFAVGNNAKRANNGS